jgi:hypothetical protein
MSHSKPQPVVSFFALLTRSCAKDDWLLASGRALYVMLDFVLNSFGDSQ